ncbi:hypothetical protein PGT21_023561 [Puccinia graminis f. sp. tritici]|uniref:PQ loop repeat-containing protein 2 n=1 Tax=Puccinia graminis f. sp. tritici TaxID=56615 RepID=A0A5B0RFL7_PUCGR|nr:hypothetical protein PGT21_023561 [Puccinia graminis f. sp. tritici]KAA1124028.1 hypothetical protein PGTUg99_021637 [Puccinia graminis f. sp. tritici]
MFSIESTSSESVSSLMGWISFACWLLVYTPQIYENYVYKSGEGVSISFVVIWMIGDLTNLFGAVKQHLLQTMIILSIYYTLCDLVLLLQIFHYRRYHRQRAAKTVSMNAPGSETGNVVSNGMASERAEAEETSPLLSRNDDSNQLENTKGSPKSICNQLYRALNYCSQALPSYITVYGLILVIGFLGWSISQNPRLDPQDPKAPPPANDGSGNGNRPTETWDITAQIMGWISAFAYLSSRVPQIFKNQVTKCHGLSLLFFLVGITGNLTYVASILTVDRSPDHILINLSWLIGSGGTIFLDLIVLYQFWSYRHERADSSIIREEVTS